MAKEPSYVIELKGKDIKDNSKSIHSNLKRSLQGDGYDLETELTRDNTIKIVGDVPKDVVKEKMDYIRGNVVGSMCRWFTYKLRTPDVEGAEAVPAEEADRDLEVDKMSATYAHEFDRMYGEIEKLKQANSSLAVIKNDTLNRNRELQEKVVNLEKENTKRAKDYEDLTRKFEEIGGNLSAKDLFIKEVEGYANSLEGYDTDIAFEDAKKAVEVTSRSERDWLAEELGCEPSAEALPPWEQSKEHLARFEDYRRAGEELKFLESLKKGEISIPAHLAEKMAKLIKKDADEIVVEEYEKEKAAYGAKYENWKRADDLRKMYAECAEVRSALEELPSPVPVYADVKGSKVNVFAPANEKGLVSATIKEALKGFTQRFDAGNVLLASFEGDDSKVEAVRKSLRETLGALGLDVKFTVTYG